MTITIDTLAVEFLATTKVADLADGYELHRVNDDYLIQTSSKENELAKVG